MREPQSGKSSNPAHTLKLFETLAVYKTCRMSDMRRSGLGKKAILVDAIGGAFEWEQVRRAQLGSILANISVTLVANCFIASSAALLVYDENRGLLIFAWLAGVFALNSLRLIYGLRQISALATHPKPATALRNLTILAFAAGVCWMPLPIYFLDSIENKAAAYIVFIMAGIATGAIIQSLAYWRVSVAFGAPILLATTIKLVMQGQTADLVVATNVFLLMGMLIRSAVMSERKFCVNHATTLQATELAQSLQQAHNEVQKANETLKRLATTDPLTGLPNRSVFNQTLAGLIHAHEHVSLALIDIDHFKSINDSKGHAAGDEALCSLALIMLDNAQEGITPIRLGGDEFAVIASGPDAESRMADYLQTMQENVKTQSGNMHGITLSIGVSGHHDKQLTASELFAATDRALYAAKSAGRNCLRTA